MTAPLPTPAIAPAAPVSIADTLGAKAAPATAKKGPSFSDVLAQQRPNPSADARPAANGGAKTPASGKSSGGAAGNAKDAAAQAIDNAVQTAAQAEAGALAVAAQQPAAPVLPQQALEIAAQVAEQTQLARGTAQAAATAISAGAAVVQAALTANDAIATPRAPVPATAQQAEAAAALASRDAQAALPVVTAAAKPGSAPVAEIAAKTAPAGELPRPAPEPAQPRAADVRVAAEPTPAAPHHVRAEEESDAPVLSTAQQFQVPQHAANAQDHLAQAIAAASQRQQPAPIANPASIAVPNVPVVLQVATPVGGTHWGTELGQQMVVMSNNVRQGTQTAELRLDPPDLGPLRVSINLADGVASASFVSAHASVRQAIETAIPQLQQALAQAGISLGQTSVGEQAAQQEFAQQNGGGSQRQGGGNGAAVADGAIDGQPVAVTASRNANALVDTFA